MEIRPESAIESCAKFVQRLCFRNRHPSPDHRADLRKTHFQLQQRTGFRCRPGICRARKPQEAFHDANCSMTPGIFVAPLSVGRNVATNLGFSPAGSRTSCSSHGRTAPPCVHIQGDSLRRTRSVLDEHLDELPACLVDSGLDAVKPVRPPAALSRPPVGCAAGTPAILGKAPYRRRSRTDKLAGIMVNAICSVTSRWPRTGSGSKFRHSIARTVRI